ncbi:MAG TPA: amidohydrolase [Arachidicoccus sp.]|nr:amidohydrolase [Arachidicoccus sp.]
MDLKDFITFRHLLHQYPDLSGFESATRELIRAFLKPFRPDKMQEVAATGLLVKFDGKKPGKTILVRAELDALPIREVNTFSHKSGDPLKSHKCGHDGHMVILCRLAWLLHQQPLDQGTAYLLFQPAEENGLGAKAVMEDPVFRALKIDQVIALHNTPGFPLGSIQIRYGAFTPAVRSIMVGFEGRTSHAAEPENGLCPATAMNLFLSKALEMAIADTASDNFFLVSPVYMRLGEKSYGITAGSGEVHLTIRAWSDTMLQQQSDLMEQMAASIGTAFRLKITTGWTQEFSANNNDPVVVDQIQRAADELSIQSISLTAPMKWGEDFGLFTQHYPGAMFGLGAGEHHPALHNPDYDFEDQLIEPGSAVFERVVRNFLC